MKKNNFFLRYGLGHNRLKNLFLKYGVSDFNSAFSNKNLDDILHKFLDLNLDKKEILLKNNHLLFLKQLGSGGISGYRRLRGLPSHNQRTKTNAKTNRVIKK